MCSGLVVIAGGDSKDVAQVDVAEDDNVIEASRQIDPISVSACPFCQGDRGAIG
jgi:hypothetical protein